MDDIFRNINGITLQMSMLEYILTKGKKGMKPRTMPKLFYDVVTLYRNDKAAYEKLLREARNMPETNHRQDRYFTWLASQVSPAQLSELYIVYADIEDFCLKRNIIPKKLFALTDLTDIRKVVDTVESNKVFRFTYRKRLSKMSSAMRFYYRFMKGHPELLAQEEFVKKTEQPSKSNKQPETVPKKPVERVSEFAKQVAPVEFSVGKSDAVKIDFANIQSLAYTQPTEFLYFGEVQVKVKSWTQLYVLVTQCLLDDYPSVLLKYLNRNIGGQGRCDFTDKIGAGNMVAPKKVQDDFYLETNLSATDIVHKIGKLLDLCNVDYENVEVFYKQKGKAVDENKPKTTKIISSINHMHTPEKATYSEGNDSNQLSSFIPQIEKYVLDADIDGVSYDDIKKVAGITMTAVKQYISNALHIVDIEGRLIHEQSFVDWEDGAEQLDRIIDKLIQKNNGYISSVQLYEYAKSDMHMFLNDNDMNRERAVYEIAQHLFGKNTYNDKHYIFTGKSHISSTSEMRSNFDIFCRFAKDHDNVFKLIELEEYLTQIGIKTGNLRGQMHIYDEPTFLYYEEGVLIYMGNVNINDEWKNIIHIALDKLFEDVGDHIVLREIQPIWYDQLPTLPGIRAWTPMLLQNVLRYYGDELGARTIIAMNSQSIETLHTMLVSNDSQVQTFGDVVVSLLLENGIQKRNFTAEELRMFLIELKAIHGGELIGNMSKALGDDERFAWDVSGNKVTVRI